MAQKADFCCRTGSVQEGTCDPYSPNMTGVHAQRYTLLAGSVLTLLSCSYVLVSAWRNPLLRKRRPGSLLFWRSVGHLGLSLTIIGNDIYNYEIAGDFPEAPALMQAVNFSGVREEFPDTVAGGYDGCQWMSFFVQFFTLFAEAWYAAITADLLINLFGSPFGSQSLRFKGYTVGAIAVSFITAYVLITGRCDPADEGCDAQVNLTDEDWGSSCIVMRHICWYKRFAVPTAGGSFVKRVGWWYYYFWVYPFYFLGGISLLLQRWKLRKGIPKTLEIRQRQLEYGFKLVLIFTVWLFCFVAFFLTLEYMMRTRPDNQETPNVVDVTVVMRAIFALWFGARGAFDGLVWLIVVVPLAKASGFTVRPWWEPRAKKGRGRQESLARRRSSRSSGLARPLMDQPGSGPEPEPEPEAPQDLDDVPESELNKSLQDEVLYFTLLGLRAAAAGQHLSKEESGNAEVDLLSASAAESGTRRSLGGEEDNIDELRGAMERMKFSYVAYSHAAFADLRELFGVDAAGYTKSLGGHKDAKFDGGASGAIMFFSADKRYIIKQVEKAERETLVKLLPGYHEHMRENDGSTMLLRVLQCCSIRMYRKELNFMVTENLFYHQGAVVKPDATYDIKGSWVDRNARGTRTHKPEGGTFKDQDLNSLIYLPTAYRNKLLLTLQSDTAFLADNNIMDYSVLLGMNNRRMSYHAASRPLRDEETPFFRVDNGGIEAALVEGPGCYQMGLIDILQDWDWHKKMERFFKVNIRRKDSEGISAVEPHAYQQRFMDGMHQITVDVTEYEGSGQMRDWGSDPHGIQSEQAGTPVAEAGVGGAADAGAAGGGAGAVMDASVEVNSAAPIAGSE